MVLIARESGQIAARPAAAGQPQERAVTDIRTVGFVGLGNMGFPMAGHLAGAGFAKRIKTAVSESRVWQFGLRSTPPIPYTFALGERTWRAHLPWPI